jgi:cytochrome bd-type quinol oxidase subunit 1
MDSNPYFKQQAQFDDTSTPEDVERGLWLTGFLVMVLIVSLFKSSIFIGKTLGIQFDGPIWFHYYLLIFGFLNIMTVLAVWFWSRLGVIGYLVFRFVDLSVVFIVGQKEIVSIVIFLVIIVVVFLACVWTKWQYMVWGFSIKPSVPNGEKGFNQSVN